MQKIQTQIWIYFFLIVPVTMAIEKPQYEILERHGSVEIRQYPKVIIAGTKVEQPYRTALYSGFRSIANYIFGGNDENMKIAMTAPVISHQVEKNVETHEILFIMPKKYEIDSLPKPDRGNVYLEERTLDKVASIRFGGWATEKRVFRYQAKLFRKISKLGLEQIGPPMVAQYNSPWALPPFRRNEILIRIR
ncbi:MAG: heme-binding protein [Candidatus Poribacteria bacterium]|jgi:hypothetical protein|nr:heme-binding protein [Candidatus Poribacteria bacterium]|tara:strand:+ start:4300 stop:4875 length:576 start_codon:yes stop_codon:yes gene_type:complete